MTEVLLVNFPFFALVLCGYLAVRSGALPGDAIRALNIFVLYFPLPCMLFRFGSSTPIAQLLDPGIAGVYLLCALLMVGATIAVTLSHRINWNDAAFGALVASFPNTGYMGVPLLVALLGQRAAGPAIMTIAIDLVVTSSLCIALSRLDGAGTHGAAVAAKNALRGVLVNPLPWAILLGVIVSALQVPLPKPFTATVWPLAESASPLALFTIGGVLARSQMASTERVPISEYVPVAVKKLVLHPILVLWVGAAAIRLGIPIDRSALVVIVLVAALPSASNVVVLAERFGADSGRIARIILVATALAFLTFSAAVALLV